MMEAKIRAKFRFSLCRPQFSYEFLPCPSFLHKRDEVVIDVHFKPPDLSNYYLTNLGWDFQVHKVVARSGLL